MAGRIFTAAEKFGVRDPLSYHAWILTRRPALEFLAANGLEASEISGPEEIAEEAPPARARVNHNRWLADCPARCGAAMMLLRGAPFLCGVCLNVELGHRYRPVAWPDDLEAIEAALLERPLPAARNWTAELGVHP